MRAEVVAITAAAPSSVTEEDTSPACLHLAFATAAMVDSRNSVSTYISLFGLLSVRLPVIKKKLI